MTQEELENNRLIAEFMNMECWDKQVRPNHYKIPYPFPIRITKCMGGNAIPLEWMKFDSSFDWLMPVIEKLHKISWAAHDCFRKIERYDLQSNYKTTVSLIKHLNEDKSLLYKQNQ